MLSSIGMNEVICSGVSCGHTGAVVPYIELMASITAGGGGVLAGSITNQSQPPNQFPHCERNGVDQGVHNVLVHTGRIKGGTRINLGHFILMYKCCLDLLSICVSVGRSEEVEPI